MERRSGIYFFFLFSPKDSFLFKKKKNRKESLTSVYTWLNLFIQTFRDFMNEKVILKKLSKLQKLGQGWQKLLSWTTVTLNSSDGLLTAPPPPRAHWGTCWAWAWLSWASPLDFQSCCFSISSLISIKTPLSCVASLRRLNLALVWNWAVIHKSIFMWSYVFPWE